MKLKNVAGATGLAALLASLSVMPGYSQVAINVPQSVSGGEESFADVFDSEDPCTSSYEAFLNEPACEAARLAQELEDETIPTAEEELEAAQEDLASAQEELADLTGELTTAQGELDEAETALATAQADAASAQQEAEDIALQVNSAERPLLAEAAREGLTLDEYLDENADDERVVALLALREGYETALSAAAELQEAITDAESTRDDALVARDEAQLAVTDFEATLSADQLETLASAQAALDAAQAELAEAQAAAAVPLPAGENVNYDIITGSDANPAKAVLQASICAAELEVEGCFVEGELVAGADDVGQAIVEGFNSLHQTDLTLGQRIDDEESARIAADEVLQANIDAEADTRAAADEVLQANIDAEAETRAAADEVLTASIATESAARAAADVTLQNNINALDARVTQLGQRVDALTKESRQGIAMAMALAAIPTVNYGKFSLGLGVGNFASETAAAIGMDFIVSERVKFKVGFSTTGDESGGSAGIAIGF